MRRIAVTALSIGATFACLVLGQPAFARDVPVQAAPQSITYPTPIKHVVVIFQENHSFDNVLGKLCVVDTRCDGTEVGTLYGGQQIALTQAPDLVPVVVHSTYAHRTAVDNGKMDGFSKIRGCTASTNYQCYSQYDPTQIPNLAALARAFVISDRTFESGGPSFGAHIVIAAATGDGFADERVTGTVPPKQGGGCPSDKDAPWLAPGATSTILVPACIPAPDGSGPYRPSPVPWVPTIMDRLDAAGVSWKIYGDEANPSGWTICPTFAECIYGPQANDITTQSQVLKDAAAGALPGYSIVTPTHKHSQHNSESMTIGDDWIGQVVSSIENGPDWSSTAIFITYDDCGCFYDHVAPPPGTGLGIRVPMVIVSPYAKPGYTDSTTANFPSILAFVEHVFNLPPLNSSLDGSAYDYANSFNFNQTPLKPVHMVMRQISARERAYMKAHPMNPNDPT